MADTLRQLGFEVIEEIDVTQKPMKKAIKAFGDRLNAAGKDAVGMFYYAGHGIQVDGENYLIPVQVEINDEADVDIEAVGVRAVLKNMAYAGNNMNIIVMDACRNNPYKRSFRSAARGLARMEASRGTLIAYATAPGGVASDGIGMNSPYTEALSAGMLKPGVTIERMFKEVRNTVVEKTNDLQVPWESSSLTGGDFYFNTTEILAVTPPIDQPVEQSYELLFWESVRSSDSVADYEAYLNRYPDGVFAPLAKAKVARLQTPNTNTTSSVILKSVGNQLDQPISNTDITGTYVSDITSNKPGAFRGDDRQMMLILEQVGDTISGTDSSGKASIEGTRVGDTITFGFSHGNIIWGNFIDGTWKVNADGTRLEGSWSYGAASVKGKWNLTRISNAQETRNPLATQNKAILTRRQTTGLLSGKTVVWEDHESSGAYYAPNGKLYTVWEGVPESGRWEVTDQGAVCWHVPSWGKTPCESYFFSADGTLMSIYEGEETEASELRHGNVTGSL